MHRHALRVLQVCLHPMLQLPTTSTRLKKLTKPWDSCALIHHNVFLPSQSPCCSNLLDFQRWLGLHVWSVQSGMHIVQQAFVGVFVRLCHTGPTVQPQEPQTDCPTAPHRRQHAPPAHCQCPPTASTAATPTAATATAAAHSTAVEAAWPTAAVAACRPHDRHQPQGRAWWPQVCECRWWCAILCCCQWW